MQWHSWSAEAFRTAAESSRPILLFITTSWSAACREMERLSFGDASVAALARDRFVAIRVDAELRPDVSDRYALDGWPSTLLLAESGEVLQGGTYLEPGPLAVLLERTSALYAARRSELVARRSRDVQNSTPAPPPGLAEPTLPDRIAASLDLSGTPKFLHADALVFLLRYGALTGRPAATQLVRETLDAADRSALCADDGRVFRCAIGADWSRPVEEITVDAHAAAMRAFAEACVALGNRYEDRLRRIAAFVTRTWLKGGQSHFFPVLGKSVTVPLPTDAAASLADACLAAASVMDEAELGRAALAFLEHATLKTYRPGKGVLHFDGPDAPVLLTDHLACTSALLSAHEATGEVPYTMLAEELGHQTLRLFFDEEAGAFRDRLHGPGDLGRLADPMHPFRLNAFGSAVLTILARVSGEHGFSDAASRAFASAARSWQAQGLDAATLGLAQLSGGGPGLHLVQDTGKPRPS